MLLRWDPGGKKRRGALGLGNPEMGPGRFSWVAGAGAMPWVQQDAVRKFRSPGQLFGKTESCRFLLCGTVCIVFLTNSVKDFQERYT